jgi:hypothetical protein
VRIAKYENAYVLVESFAVNISGPVNVFSLGNSLTAFTRYAGSVTRRSLWKINRSR